MADAADANPVKEEGKGEKGGGKQVAKEGESKQNRRSSVSAIGFSKGMAKGMKNRNAPVLFWEFTRKLKQ